MEAPQKKVTLKRKRVVRMDETSGTLWQRLNGQVGLNFNYTKGNESSQYSLNSQIGYVEERWQPTPRA